MGLSPTYQIQSFSPMNGLTSNSLSNEHNMRVDGRVINKYLIIPKQLLLSTEQCGLE